MSVPNDMEVDKVSDEVDDEVADELGDSNTLFHSQKLRLKGSSTKKISIAQISYFG